MDFLKNFEFTPVNIMKAAIVAVAGLAVVVIVLTLMQSLFGSFRLGVGYDGDYAMTEPSGKPTYGMGGGEEMAYDSYGGANLSVRNVVGAMMPDIAPMPPMYGGTTGSDAEEFEVTEYSAFIETGDKSGTCGTIAELKSRDYVIFENANEYDRECSFTFKVQHARVEEILALIEGLDPRELSENTYTIKNLVDDFTSETDILTKKRASIDQTLQNAITAYDEITRLATASQNADALAKIIDSKLQLIERLTQERININEQLDRIERAKAEQLDRLEYTYFRVTVLEQKYIDGEQLKNSWQEGIRQFIRSLNQSAQDLTINLITLLVLAVQYIIYFFILLFIAKYVWRAAKYIWQK